MVQFDRRSAQRCNWRTGSSAGWTRTSGARLLGDWKPLAEMYTEDATYGWNYGPKDDLMAVGRDEIRDLALGQEMDGLEGWEYPYQQFVIDDAAATSSDSGSRCPRRTRDDGTIDGIGGSWFGLRRLPMVPWQRDFFDFGNVQKASSSSDRVRRARSEGMQERIERSLAGEKLPGYYPLGTSAGPDLVRHGGQPAGWSMV